MLRPAAAQGARRADSGILFAQSGLDAYLDALPFAPTGAQRRAIGEVAADCASGRPMNRLVQGDVGSGKTVVAAALCALAARRTAGRPLSWRRPRSSPSSTRKRSPPAGPAGHFPPCSPAR